jgi:hypothetical protein
VACYRTREAEPIKTTTFFAQSIGAYLGGFMFLGEMKSKYAHPPLFLLVSIRERLGVVCRLSCFNSRIRHLFVSGSHLGCIGTTVMLLPFRLLHLNRSSTSVRFATVSRKNANATTRLFPQPTAEDKSNTSFLKHLNEDGSSDPARSRNITAVSKPSRFTPARKR